MSLIDSYPLRQVTTVADPPRLYADLMALILRFASQGLIHGDFTEFNILVHDKTQIPVVIDFPQMVSVDHANAKWYFDRDVQCIKTFFDRRFHYKCDDDGPHWSDVERVGHLDVEVEASGFSREQAKALDKYLRDNAALMEVTSTNGTEDGSGDEEEDEEEEQKDEEEVEEPLHDFEPSKYNGGTGEVDKFGNSIPTTSKKLATVAV